MGVRGQHCPAITQAPQALHSHALPGVQQVTVQVLTTQTTEPSCPPPTATLFTQRSLSAPTPARFDKRTNCKTTELEELKRVI